MLEDQPVRSLIGKNVFDLEDEVHFSEINSTCLTFFYYIIISTISNLLNQGIDMKTFPQIFKIIENKEYTLKIKIIRSNIEKGCKLYKVTDLFEISSVVEN